MEKKKLLIVAVSVGIFLVIVICAILIASNPKGNASDPAYSSSRPIPAGNDWQVPASADPVDMVRNGEQLNEFQALPPDEGDFRVSGETAGRTPAAPAPVSAPGVTIAVPPPRTVAVPETPAPRAPQPAVRQPAPAPAPNPVAPQPPKPPKPPKPPVTKPAPPAQYYNDYWVQTGAFSTKVRAEGVKETLAQKGITSIIENREINGKVLYRVRVGPYTSEKEANYWLALVKAIDGFGDSQVRLSKTLR